MKQDETYIYIKSGLDVEGKSGGDTGTLQLLFSISWVVYHYY